MGLQAYQQDTSALLNDQAYLFTPLVQLNRWINVARSDIAKQTGCIQRLLTGQSALGSSAQPGFLIPGAIQPGALPNAIPAIDNPLSSLSSSQNNFMTIPGVERYPYQGFFNPLLQAAYAGVKGVVDTVTISIAWESAYRPAMRWMAWEDFQAYCRAFANQTTSYPCVWSVFNDGEQGEVWLFPVPSQANEMEAYVTCVPSPIYSDDDYDAIPEEMREAVKFKAASLAFMAGQRYGQAQLMESLFMQTLGNNVVARDRGKTASFYNTVF